MPDDVVKIGFDAADLITGADLVFEAMSKMQDAVAGFAQTLADENASMEQQAAAYKTLTDAINEQLAAAKLQADTTKGNAAANRIINDLIRGKIELERQDTREIEANIRANQKRLESEKKLAEIAKQKTAAMVAGIQREVTTTRSEDFERGIEQRLGLIKEQTRTTQQKNLETQKEIDLARKLQATMVESTQQGIAKQRQEATELEMQQRLNVVATQRAEAERRRVEQGAATRAAAGRALTGGLGITVPTGANVAAVASFQSAVNRLAAAATSANVPLRDMQALWAQLRANPANLTMVPALQGVQAAMLNVLGAAQRMKASVNDAGASGARAGQQLLISWQGVVRLVESQIIRRGFITLAQDLRNSVEQSIEFGRTIAELQTLSGRAGGSFAQWETSVRRLSESQFGKPQADVAAAAYQGLSGQVVKTASDFESFGNQAVKLANATGATASDAAQLLTTSLNAYNLTAADSQKVSEILFSTFEKGRTKLADMQGSFGRVAVTAGQLGISLEETSNVLNNLTSSGVKFADATSMLNAIFQQILKPSKELNEVFEKMGLGTVDTAIRIVGLSGVLQILNQEAGKGVTNLADLEKNFRSIRATLALTGKDFKDIGTSMESAAQKAEAYRQAQANFAAVPGAKFQQDMEKLKNFFTDDLGKAIVKAIEDFSGTFGSLSDIVKKAVTDIIKIFTTLKDTIKFLYEITVPLKLLGTVIGLLNPTIVSFAAAWVGAKVAVAAWNVQQDLNRARLKLTEAALFEEQATLATGIQVTTSAAGANVALASSYGEVAAAAGTATTVVRGFSVATGAVGLLGLAVGLLLEKWITAKSAVEEFAEASEKEMRARSEATNKIVEQEILSMEKRKDADIEHLNARFKEYLLYANKVIEKAKAIEDVELTQLKNTEEQLRVTSKGYEETLSRAIDNTSRKAREFQKIVEDTPKDIYKLRGAAEDAAERIQAKWANNSQQLTLLEGKRARLEKEQREALATGTAESLKEAIRYGEEIIKIEEQITDKKGEAARERYEEDIRTGQAYPSGISPTGQRTYAPFTFRPTEGIQRENDAYMKQIDLLKQIQKIAAENQAREESKLRDQEENRKATIDVLKKLQTAEEQLFKPTGELRNKDTAIKQYDELNKLFTEAYGVVKDPALLKSIQDTQQHFATLFNVEGMKEGLIDNLETLKKHKDEFEEIIKTQTKYTEQTIKDSKERAEALGGEVKWMEAMLKFQSTGTVAQGISALLQGKLTQFRDEYRTESAAAPLRAEALKRVEAVFSQIVALQARGVPPARAEVEKLGKAWADAYEHVKPFLEAKTGLGPAGVLTNRTATETITSMNVGMVKLLDLLRQSSEDYETHKKKIAEAETAIKDIDERAKKIPESMKTLQSQAPGVGDALKENIGKVFKGVADDTDKTLKNLEEIEKKQKGAPVPGIPRPSPVGGAGGSFAPDYGGGGSFGNDYLSYKYATGGLVGGPRGTDVIPAWLSAGEYVMNPLSTSRFFSQLVAMNHGQQPQYFATGGIVKTANFGDINVNVTGGDTDKATARNIARELRREIRRGTVAFID